MELLVHVGDGKTGTSAIQRMLLTHPDALAHARTHYLGLMLEYAFETSYDWQRPGGIEAFHALPREQAIAQLRDVLRGALDRARSAGLARLVWSNESLLDRSDTTIAALAQLGDGVRVRVVAYVRRHDAWARSAYIQWGLKHKAYAGPLRDFGSWRGKRSFRLMPRLQPWRTAFGTAMTVRNFDAVADAARDFCEVAGLDPAAFATERRNQEPSGVELALRAVFNEAVPGPALPSHFDQALAADTVDFDRSLEGWLGERMPSQEALASIAESCSDDRSGLNALLAADGQRALDALPLARGPIRVDQEKLVAALCQIVARQALRLERLERKIASDARLSAGEGATPPGIDTKAVAGKDGNA